MNHRLLSISVLFLALASQQVYSGEIATNCFRSGQLGSCSERVLQHVEFKSVVLQFVDPGDTGLGEGLSRIYWREILESISDLSNAGVILAYDRAGQIEEALGEADLGQFLQREYHDAARAIALQQGANMAIWGAILPDGDRLYVQTFLTLQHSSEDPWTTISFAGEATGDVAMSVVLGRDRLNLPALDRTRESLFHRWFITRCRMSSGCPRGVELRDHPSPESRVIGYVPTGGRIEVTDMQGRWMKVRSPEDREQDSWINVYHVEMFPETIEFAHRRNVNFRASPNGEKIGPVDLDGRYGVLDAKRHGRYDEPWYLIKVHGREGWVAGRLISKRSYIFSGVHLVAGLYRYGRGQYSRAANEFRAFIDNTSSQDNVTRAAAYKFLAASHLAGARVHSGRVENALSDIDAAVKLTPFDASGYTLRALVNAGGARQLQPAIKDLEQALKLNRRDTGALQMLESMSQAYIKEDPRSSPPRLISPALTTEIKQLEKAYLQKKDSGGN